MTRLVGILNLTPDSFSDGGQFVNPAAAVAQYHQLLEDGAAFVDMGAESTRPGATPLGDEAEWARLEPVLAQLDLSRVSIDTYHAESARRALAMGAAVINDVGGLGDAAMRAVLAASDCPVIVMHALTLPADPAVTWPEGTDPVAAILAWKRDITQLAIASGIAAERLIYDPGLGFGKTAEQSLALLDRVAELVRSGGDWLYGHSKKSLYKSIEKNENVSRETLTVDYSRRLIEAGVQYLRVHDVAAHRALPGVEFH